MSLLILTGATVTFKDLISEVTLAQFVLDLKKIGIKNLFIQYGNEPPRKSQEFFEASITESGLKFSSLNAIYNLFDSDFSIEAFPFSSSIADFIDKADIVVSHAGTGSIIDVLKQDKPLIVVVNETLMDNHQTDVANEFLQLGHCIVSKTKDLSDAIKRVYSEEEIFSKFDSCSNSIVQGIIYYEADQGQQ